MHHRLAADLTDLPALLDAARERAVAFLDGLPERPVVPAWQPPPEAPLPERGTGLRGALAEFGDDWEPGLSTSAGPRHLGFVTGGATPAAPAGDWLTATADQNSSTSLDGAGQALERRTVAWPRELFGLSGAHAGTFVSGATVSNTVGLPAPVRLNVVCFTLSGEPTAERLRAFADAVAPGGVRDTDDVQRYARAAGRVQQLAHRGGGRRPRRGGADGGGPRTVNTEHGGGGPGGGPDPRRHVRAASVAACAP